jgi:hypothetical protein
VVDKHVPPAQLAAGPGRSSEPNPAKASEKVPAAADHQLPKKIRQKKHLLVGARVHLTTRGSKWMARLAASPFAGCA